MSDPEHQEWKHMFGCKVKTPIDMPDDIFMDAINVSTKYISELPDADWDSKGQEVVQKIKRDMDNRWERNWHVVVGHSFGSFVTHETKRFLYFYFNDKAVLLFKAG